MMGLNRSEKPIKEGGLRKFMWPTLETASRIYDWANITLIVSLVAGVISTVLVVWMGDKKEAYLKFELSDRAADAAHAELQIATLDLRAKQLEKDTSAANERAAEAEARALEARLELEKFKAPRNISARQQEIIGSSLSAFRGQSYCVLIPPAGIDTESLLAQLVGALSRGHWQLVNPPGLVTGSPPHGIAITAPPGVYVGYAPSQTAKLKSVADALAKQLSAIGIESQSGGDTEGERDTNTLRIVIGLKRS
jgi:hypothetical protein